MEQIQQNLYRKNNKIYTKTIKNSEKVYGETIIEKNGQKYRNWQPSRSKAAAAIMKNIKLEIKPDDTILYLGAASGTTVSHFSDIVDQGFIYAVEYSKEVIKDLVNLSETRKNIAPILADARKPEQYQEIIEHKVDIVFQDISQKDQPEILIKNAEKYLKKTGTAYIAVKAHSISTSKDEEKIYQEVKQKLKQKFNIIEQKTLEPYEKHHLFLKMKPKEENPK